MPDGMPAWGVCQGSTAYGKGKIMAKSIPTLSAASRKAVNSILIQQAGTKQWDAKAHAFGLARLAEYCGIGEVPDRGTLSDEEYAKLVADTAKASRKEYANEILENGWAYASNLKKVLEGMGLIPAKDEVLSEYDN